MHDNTIPTCDKTKKISMIDKVQNEMWIKCKKSMKMEIIGGLQNSLYIKLFGNEIEMFGKGSTFEFNPFYARIDFELIF